MIITCQVRCHVQAPVYIINKQKSLLFVFSFTIIYLNNNAEATDNSHLDRYDEALVKGT